ncbi:arsenate reductase ArsC [Leptothrix discophora]|uniref:Arsenate reductase ArsC n=1 Tax=Leptothrix discophora TaxID=89 RepID=A0ABT9G1A9_LEPDI|nr:arsenate reductase ArsC [Leptothrix discophora]MDP4300274.1 arsenate reductase ArsC [Leptothrix discophora]
MSDPVHHVLFLCTHNSARSILAESLLNGLGHGRFKGWSAGSQPSGQVHPLALRTLQGMHLPTEGLHSKSWDEFARTGAPAFDFIVTVCDDAAGEECPVWPGHPVRAHWGVADPSRVEGDDAHRARAFYDTALLLKRRIELMLALPLAALDADHRQREMHAIGTR